MRFDQDDPETLASKCERLADDIYRKTTRTEEEGVIQDMLYAAAAQIRTLMDEVESCHPE